MKGPVKDRLRLYDLFDAVGPGRFCPTIGTAVDGYLAATGTTWVDWEERPPAGPEPSPDASRVTAPDKPAPGTRFSGARGGGPPGAADR